MFFGRFRSLSWMNWSNWFLMNVTFVKSIDEFGRFWEWESSFGFLFYHLQFLVFALSLINIKSHSLLETRTLERNIYGTIVFAKFVFKFSFFMLFTSRRKSVFRFSWRVNDLLAWTKTRSRTWHNLHWVVLALAVSASTSKVSFMRRRSNSNRSFWRLALWMRNWFLTFNFMKIWIRKSRNFFSIWIIRFPISALWLCILTHILILSWRTKWTPFFLYRTLYP